MRVSLRPAVPSDAAAVANLLRRSIIEVCGPVYSNDVVLLQQWTANKTAENALSWMSNPSNQMIVAVDDLSSAILGVGLIQFSESAPNAQILLCYVLPESVRQGVGRMIAYALEDLARKRGIQTICLDASMAAVNFYIRLGYQAIKLNHAPPMNLSMEKELV